MNESRAPTSEARNSIWTMAGLPKTQQRITTDWEGDVCVIGAGIAGMTCAYLLAKEGRSVVVLDDGPIGGGQTAYTTAHLSNVIDDRYVEIERLHGEEGARLAAESHTTAIDLIETVVRDERIDCDFERLNGYLLFPASGSTVSYEEEYEAARRAGLAVERVNWSPIPCYDTGPCLRFSRQAQFHPLRYLDGLLTAIRQMGGNIFSDSHVESVDSGSPIRIHVKHGPVLNTESVIIATNTPINDRVAIHTKQAPYMSYVVAARIPRGAVRRALYWDTLDPYHYVRLQSGASAEAELIIIGGEDHKTGQASDATERFDRLIEWGRVRIPTLGRVEFRWCGQVMETIDGLAFIGRNPFDSGNVYVATGDSGMGMTHGTIAGILLTDLICGRSNPWTELYSPSRKPVSAAGEFAKENLNVIGQYSEWLSRGDVDSLEQIQPGNGAILRQGLRKVSVFRTETGDVIQRSAACPHLGCIVKWNSVANTWDCPCHGSRFDPYGTVINGPANGNLSTLEPVQETQ